MALVLGDLYRALVEAGASRDAAMAAAEEACVATRAVVADRAILPHLPLRAVAWMPEA